MFDLNNRSHIYADAMSMIRIKEKIYFRNYSDPGMYVYDIKNNKVEMIDDKDRPSEWKEYEYCSGAVVGDRYIVYPPYYGDRYISVLDTYSYKITYFKFDTEIKYRTGVVVGEKVYLVPESTNDLSDIVEFDICTGKIYRNRFNNKLNQNDMLICDCGDIQLYDHSIFLPSSRYGRIYKISFDEFIVESIDIPGVDYLISSICIESDNMWISGEKDEIIKYNSKGELFKIVIENNENYIPWKQRFGKPLVWNGYIYYPPVFYNSFIKIDLRTCKYEKILEVDNEDIVWNLSKIGEYKIYASTMKYKNRIPQNYIITESGTVETDNGEFSIDEFYYCNSLLEERTHLCIRKFVSNICDGNNKSHFYG